MPTAQPGQLTLSELAGSGDAPFAHSCQVALAAQVLPHLAVTHGAHGRHTLMQISATAQSRYFFNKAQFQHFVESRFDSLVQQTALLWCNRNLNPIVRVLHTTAAAGLPRAHGLTRGTKHFQRPADTLRMVGMQSRGAEG